MSRFLEKTGHLNGIREVQKKNIFFPQKRLFFPRGRKKFAPKKNYFFVKIPKIHNLTNF